MKKMLWKSVFALALSIAMLLICCSCTNGNTDTEETTAPTDHITTESSEQATVTTEALTNEETTALSLQVLDDLDQVVQLLEGGAWR